METKQSTIEKVSKAVRAGAVFVCLAVTPAFGQDINRSAWFLPSGTPTANTRTFSVPTFLVFNEHHQQASKIDNMKMTLAVQPGGYVKINLDFDYINHSINNPRSGPGPGASYRIYFYDASNQPMPGGALYASFAQFRDACNRNRPKHGIDLYPAHYGRKIFDDAVKAAIQWENADGDLPC